MIDRTFQQILSFLELPLNEVVYVEAVLCNGGYWTGPITQERWEEVKQEELEAELTDLNA